MSSTRSADLYDVLGVAKTASAEEVRKAYKKKALETHPDKLGPGASQEDVLAAELSFHKIKEAFGILGDSDKRRAYDARLAYRSNTDLRSLSEQTAQRMADRKAWDQKRQEEHRIRMEDIRRQHEILRRAREQITTAIDAQTQLITEMLEEMYAANPELEARRRTLLRNKAEREKSDVRTRRPPPLRSWTA